MDKTLLKNFIEKDEAENTKQIPGLHSIYRPVSEKFRSLPPHIPKGKLFLLKPKLIKPHSVPEHKRIKPPRFIPFEPYPCAISLIVKPSCKKNIKKRCVNINTLVSKICIDTNKLEEKESSEKEMDTTEENETIRRLKGERDYFKRQFKSQTQINSEIKSLLMAVVGEDLQAKVKILKEDKLHFDKALVDSMDNLSTHTDQIEFLTGQCEVWRSKFLASSVMIEKLASWKTDLTEKNDTLVNNNFEMLKLIESLRLMQSEILKNLVFLANLKDIHIPAGDVLSLATENLNITQHMVLNSNFGIPNELNIKNLDQRTEIEKLCLQTLKNIRNKLVDTDDAFEAIVQQAKVKKTDVNIDILN